MRIALITPGFSANEYDWCIPVLRNLARDLAQSHEISVYALTYPSFAKDYEVAGVPVTSFGDGRTGLVAQIRRLTRAYRRLRADHNQRPFAVLHGFWADQGGLLAAVAGQRLDIPSVVSVMAGELIDEPTIGYGKRRHPVSGRLATYGARHAKVITVSSPYHRARLAAEQPAITASVVVLGVDQNLFQPKGPVTPLLGDPSLLMVGSLVPLKGHIVALRALRRVRERLPDAHLHLAGSGAGEKTLREAVSELGLTEAVTFHGHVPHGDLPGFYHGSELCLLASYFENHGMVVLEAAACGRVTVGTAVGLLPDLVPADLLCNPGDEAGMATALQGLLTAEKRRKQLEQALVTSIDECYSLAHTTQDFKSIYGRLAVPQPAR